MSWIRIDDGARVHAKVVKAGNEAASFWMWAIQYSSLNRTDGFIADSALHTVPPVAIKPKKAKELAEACVDAWIKPGECGLFERTEGGYLIHDFHDYQPPSAKRSPEEQAELSAKRRQSGAKGLANRWQRDGKPIASLPSGLPEVATEPSQTDGNLLQTDGIPSHAGAGVRARAQAGARRGRDREDQQEGEESIDPAADDGAGAGVPGLDPDEPTAEQEETQQAFAERCAQAYAQGIADGGGHPWRMLDASYEIPFVVEGVASHAPKLRGDDRLEWIQRAAATYRRVNDGRETYERGFRPSKWLEWLNCGGMRRGFKRTMASPGEDLVAARTREAQLRVLGEVPKR